MSFLSISKRTTKAYVVPLASSECLTQNSARLVKRVKELLSKNGARTSPIAFLFEKKGSITLTPNGGEAGYEHLFDLAVEAGAEDVKEAECEDGSVEFEVGNAPLLRAVGNADLLLKKGYHHTFRPFIHNINSSIKPRLFFTIIRPRLSPE